MFTGEQFEVEEPVVCTKETDKAILVYVNGKDCWVAKSQISDDSEVYKAGTDGTLIISKWLAEKLGWAMLVVGLVAGLGATSCTQNQRARGFGGTTEYALDPGRKLVNVTWKEDDLWFLDRPMREGETAEKYVFAESSSFGVWNGKIVVYETGKVGDLVPKMK